MSRSGGEAEGAAALVAELREEGCEVEVAACDAADRQQLAALLAAIPPERPLSAVIHAAGVLDDGLLATLTPERLERVLAPKLDAALHLHELTREHALTDFVVFSSFAGIVGSPGQGNYAAANVFLDALVQRRCAEGLPGVSLAWGPWASEAGMAGALAADRARMERLGVTALAVAQGLELFDRARTVSRPLQVPVELSTAALREQARAGTLPAVLSGLLPAGSLRPREAASSLARRLEELPEAEWDQAIAALVRGQVAAIRGYESPEAVDPERAFNELGFDSLDAVALRNQLNRVTGLRLPSTLTFDHPTPAALARHVRTRVQEDARGASAASAVRRGGSTRRHSHEPIAIVGMSCRLPGGVRSSQELWELVASGRDAIGPFPDDRDWELERLYDPDPDRPGTCYAREGGFVYDAAEFDAAFFGVSQHEALAMDPQQRLLLETAWEACEDARIDPVSLRGSDTGVFVGATASDYAARVSGELEGFRLTGTTSSVASGRVAYTYGLEGPAVTVDTACSSSLVALHLACSALRQGECAMALAGGMTIATGPDLYVDFARQRGLAPDGRCKSFAEAADGVAFSDGGGLVVLERLSDARRLGHRVLAVVRGSATNQDGASNGLSAPNGPSQERVIHSALADAGLAPGDVDAVEGHGTGTTLGDPIEAQALLATYGRDRMGDPLWLGSVKSNIGHTVCGAGIAGVIKMVQALRHEELPPTLHVDAPSAHVDWEAGGVRLLTEATPWPSGGRPRRAGVSSFGISGSNGHVILEEAPVGREQSASPARPPVEPTAAVSSAAESSAAIEPAAPLSAMPLVLSAKSELALREQAARLCTRLQGDAELVPLDVAFTLASGRARMERRAVVVSGEREGLLEGLRALSRGESAVGVHEGVERAGTTAFLFTGQGAQRVGMGRELREVFPVFRDALDGVSAAFEGSLSRPLLEVLFAEESSSEAALLDATEFAQAGLFAVEVALFRLLESLGVRPDYLVGHSIGELAAAHVAGVFSLTDACRLVAARGRLMGALPAGGAMLAVEATEEEVRDALVGLEERLSIAAVNGPHAVVVSGEEGAALEWGAGWEERGRRTKRLRVSHAFHSPLMEPMLEEFRGVAEGIEYGVARIPVVSNVTGRLALEGEHASGEYWVRHVREAVRFAEGVEALRAAGVTRFVELGPDGVLAAMARECLGEDAGQSVLAVAALRRERPEMEALLGCLAQAYCAGVRVDWPALFAGRGAQGVDLPTYPFQRERFWLHGRAGVEDLRAAGLHAGEHPLLGAAVRLAGERDEWLFTGRLSQSTHPWAAEHVLLDAAVLPGTAFLELVSSAGVQIGCEVVQELDLEAPLVLGEGAVHLQLHVEEPTESGERAFAIHSRAQAEHYMDGADVDTGWTRNASGVLVSHSQTPTSSPASGPLERLAAEAWPPVGAEPLDVDEFYEHTRAVGFAYGPAFTGVRAVWRRGEELFAEVALERPYADETARYLIHPALFDGAVQVGMAEVQDGEGALGRGLMLFSLSGVSRYTDGASVLRVSLTSAGVLTWSLAAVDESGAPVVSVDAMAYRQVEARQLAGVERRARDSLFGVEWVRAERGAVSGDRSLGTLASGEDPRFGQRVAVLGELEVPGCEERYANVGALGEAVAAGAPVPDVVLAAAPGGWEDGETSVSAPADGGVKGAVSVSVPIDGGELAGDVRLALGGTVELLRAWLGDERLASGCLALVSRGAVGVGEGAVTGLVGASVWGLGCSAQSEHPGRLLLVDVDGTEASWGALVGALSSGDRSRGTLAFGEHPRFGQRLALRDGHIHVPRLVRVPSAVSGVEGGDGVGLFDPEGTVLVTGGTGGLGVELARYLAGVCGARRLVLVSRGGGVGVGELVEELGGLGCEVVVAACDVADREQVAAVLGAIPEERPLRVVVHAAGVLDDGVVTALTPEQLDRVLRPKVDGALVLDELTRDLELDQFVLFSSFAGVLGAPGQGNYAAANAFLDALAVRRRAEGLAGVSVAWGPWAGGMAGGLDESDRARWERMGVSALAVEEGLELFGQACGAGRALVVATGLRLSVLRAQARAGVLPGLFDGLVGGVARGEGGGLARRLGVLPEGEWDRVILGLVCDQVAVVRGLESGAAVDPGLTFRELGFDSLDAIELRNYLARVTGLRFPATLIFDYPTPAAVVGFVRARVVGEHGAGERGGVVGRRARRRSEEPVAIVGMGCRFPGGVRSAEELWELVAAGRDAMGGFPDDREWDLERLYDPDPDRPGTCYAREGGFVDDVAEFDARFFGISPHEALAMDPQQRLLLEVAWEACEDARIDPVSLRGSDTGVFVGAATSNYAARVSGELESFRLTGTTSSVFSGRLAYTYGLEGPAVTVDTACSSSLVALHLACSALRQGECALALAGGMTVMTDPDLYVDFARQRGLAVDGRCKSYAESADGVAFSDGGGLVVLERLSDARRLGHRVLAVVRGSATNQDGASNGLSAPNGPSQERVIQNALADAGLTPDEVDAVEGHGTGTTLGDPIEVQALLATYGQGRSNGPLWLGSVKSNIGHTVCGAGIAGVIKMVQALRREELPRTLHVDAPSAHVDWESGGVRLLTESAPWPRGGRPRRAAVSSFGISGSNGHVILEEAPVSSGREQATAATPLPAIPLVLSARGEPALREQAARLCARLQGDVELVPLDVAYTLTRRARLERRAVVVGSEREALLEGLRALSRGESTVGVYEGLQCAGATAFLFTGQGAQRVGMGGELCEVFPVFAEAFDRVCTGLDGHLQRPLREVLFAEEGSVEAALLDGTEFAQAGLFAVEVALFRLLESFGVKPDYLVGHSIGELAAAHVAGVFSLADACRLVAARGRLMAALPVGGAMLAVEASEGEVREALEGVEGLSVAAVNGPRAVVVSGEVGVLEEWGGQWGERGRRVKRLRVSHAFHSVLMEPMLEEFRGVAEGIEYAPARIPVVSNVTGRLAAGEEHACGEYWVRHVREAVRFADGVGALRAAGVTRFVELGPDGVLAAMTRECLDADPDPDRSRETLASGEHPRFGRQEAGEGALTVAALHRERPEMEALLGCLAQAHCAGVGIDWHVLFAGRGARGADLPSYPFQRERFWLQARAGTEDLRAAGLRSAEHPLLGASVRLAGERDEWLFTGRLSTSSHPWVSDHVLLDATVLPGTVFLELASAAGEQVGCAAMRELDLEAPLVLGEGAVQLQVHMEEPDGSGARAFAIHSRAQAENDDDLDGQDGDAGWTRHASGVLVPDSQTPMSSPASGHLERLAAEAWPPAGAEPLDVEELYDQTQAAGFAYGPAFRGIRAAWRRGEECFAEVALEEPHAGEAARYLLHPALFDAAVQVGTAEGRRGEGFVGEGAGERGLMLFGWSGVRRYAGGASSLRVLLTSAGESAWCLAAVDEAGVPVVSVDEVSYRRVEVGQLAGAGRRGRDSLFGVEWVRSEGGVVGGDRSRGVLASGEDPGFGRRVVVVGDLVVPGCEERYADVGALGEAVAAGAVVPDVVLVAAPGAGVDGVVSVSAPGDGGEDGAVSVLAGGDGGEVAGDVRVALGGVLELLRGWLGDERLASGCLALVSCGAVAVGEGEVPGLVGASVWGLGCSAQSEHPGRLVLVDVDGGEASWGALVGALSLDDRGRGALAFWRASPFRPAAGVARRLCPCAASCAGAGCGVWC